MNKRNFNPRFGGKNIKISRDEIDKKTKEYLKKGGKITKIVLGVDDN